MKAGKITEDVHVAGAELARVRVEGGEAAEGTVRHWAGHGRSQKGLDYLRVRWEGLEQRRDVI